MSLFPAPRMMFFTRVCFGPGALLGALLTVSAAGFPVSTFDATLRDAFRGRDVTLRVYYPKNFPGAAPVVLVSHGGTGSTVGHTRFAHLGTEYAAHGYVSVHLNHLPSTSDLQHLLDRPTDVSFVLDQLEGGAVAFPPSFEGTLDFQRVAHVGHSWGAYTAHALGGASFTHGSLGDARIKAICPLSPQGPGGFGAFDLGPSSNSWRHVSIPTCSFVGEWEKDSSVGGGNAMEDWRLFPFMRYPTTADHYLSVLPGQDHGDIGNDGPPAVQDFIAQNSRVFLDVYLKGEWFKTCDIGQLAFFPGTVSSRKFDPETGLPAGCCPTAGATRILSPHADAVLREQNPNANFDTNEILRVSGGNPGTAQQAVLKFKVQGVVGTVTNARLRLFNQNLRPGTVSVYAMGTGWDESTVTWNNAPPPLELLDAVVNPPTGQYAEWEVTSLVTANGTYAFRLTHTDPTANQSLTSREGGPNPPQLIVGFTTGARVAAWRRVYFGTTNNTGVAANDADFDLDGQPNFIEYGLKRRPDKSTFPDGASNLSRPVLNHPHPALSNRLTLRIDMPAEPPPDVIYEVWESEDLDGWRVIARNEKGGPWSDLGSGSPIRQGLPADGRGLVDIGSTLPLDSYPGRRVFLQVVLREAAP